MEYLFNIILTTSIYASVVGIVIIIFKTILKNRINAFWHYAIWGILLLKLVVPFGPESAVSLFNTVPIHTQEINTVYQTWQKNAAAGAAVHTEATTTAKPEMKLASEEVSIEDIVPYIWFSGILLMLLGLIFINCSFHIKLRKKTISADERVNSILEACKSRLKIRDNIQVMFQDIIGTPSLFGIIRPKILLTSAVSNLSDKELQYVLLHELAHYKRKDLFVNYLLLVLQAVHWFNPIMWYCFMRVRQDMELATDEMVLGILENSEHKDYGKALLAVLESFNSPKLIPKLLGMIDDKKNIKRRIKMIEMAKLFKSKKRIIMTVGLLCIIGLAVVLLTNGKPVSTTNNYKNDLIYKNDKYGFSFTLPDSWRGKYIVKDNGDTVSVHNKLLSESTPDGYFGTLFTIHVYSPKDKWKTEGMQLADVTGMRKIAEDDNAVFAVRMPTDVQFDPQNADEYRNMEKDVQAIINTFIINNSIQSNTNKISTFSDFTGLEGDKIREIRFELFNSLFKSNKQEPLNISDKEMIVDLIRQLNSIKLLPYLKEKRLTLPMSGFYLVLDSGNGDTYFYIDYKTGGIVKYAPYMSSLPRFEYRFEDTKQLRKVAYEFISKLPIKSNSLEYAVSEAILSKKSSYLAGEAAAEGHVILDTEEKNGKIKVYTVSSFGWFGFENGIFTKVSGSGAIPTVITFLRNQKSEYSLLEYKEPVDGAGYTKSIKQMFPQKLWNQVLTVNKYQELTKQQETQAAQYLKSIGREAKISEKYVEKKLPNINVEASNTLFSEFTKENQELNEFPYWLGTKEKLENGVRYIYQTLQSKADDGCDLIAFKKTKQDGAVVKEYRYKIVGSEPRLINLVND
ncbi:MAG: M56 family metallopeptidase [Deltaproteobacteria bacterium]